MDDKLKSLQTQFDKVIDEREMCYKDRAKIFNKYRKAVTLLEEIRGMIKCDHEYSGECSGCIADEMINKFISSI